MGNDWETTQTKRKSRQGLKRAFVGNLRQRSDLVDRLRTHFAQSGIGISEEGKNCGITVVKRAHTAGSSSNPTCFALVECDLGLAIKCLNGTEFDGQIISVKAEKPPGSKMGGRGGGGLGRGVGGVVLRITQTD